MAAAHPRTGTPWVAAAGQILNDRVRLGAYGAAGQLLSFQLPMPMSDVKRLFVVFDQPEHDLKRQPISSKL